jgi:hypothetical protein
MNATTQLVRHEPGSGKVLSIYLDAERGQFQTGLDSNLRTIESRLEEASELADLRAAARVARDYATSHHFKAKTVALFALANGAVSVQELDVPTPREVRWLDHPYVQPLQEALDEYEELLVAVVGPIQTRLLSSFLGFTTEELTVINPSDPSDEQVDDYLPRVVEAVGQLADDHKIGRIMLAGNHGINIELLFLLPKDLRRRVVGFLSLPANATQKQLEDAVTSARCRVEREQETAKILRLFNRACMADGAVTGPAATLEALNEGRIEELEYAEGVSILGSHCETCNCLYVAQAICPRCQSAVRPVEDLIDIIILRALQKGATVEQVRNEAADNLRAAGGIGAFVKG